MIELKEAPASTDPIPTTAPAAFPRGGAKNVLANERIRVWDVAWAPGEPAREVRYAHDAVEVVVAGGTLVARGPAGREIACLVAPKDARDVERGTIEAVRASAGAPRTITVEIK